MKIVLAEEQNGSQPSEKTFNQAIIRIGRDPVDCQITFDNAKYPMVSRKHAELRWEGGKWFLLDLNSSYGSYVNGQRVVGSQIISVGSILQFGTQGPTVRVVFIESADAPQNVAVNQPQNIQPLNVQPTPFQPPPIVQNQPKSQQIGQNAPNPSAPAQLDFIDSAIHFSPFHLTKPQIWLGREPSCDIVFQSDAVMVSRKHAEITNHNGTFLLTDNNSFNGTLVNGQRISTQTPIYHNDEIQLGVGGPIVKFNSPSRIAPKGASLAGQRAVAASNIAPAAAALDSFENLGSKTMVANLGNISQKVVLDDSSQPTLLMSLTFGNKPELSIGRAEENDIVLDGLQISNRHARLVQSNAGIVIEDFNSTNGVYINGARVSRQGILPGDHVQIGSFLLQIDQNGVIGIFDTRSKTRIDSVNITKEVKNHSGGGLIKLLDNVSLSIQPNEFVGLLGPSGAGKSTFMDALNGMRPASGGSVLINNLDLYQHLDSLKQSIGYVPQDDIIHRELTVYRTLYYVAKLRLSGDVSKKEINQIIDEVMDVTGLSERRDVPINQLSGGQRKRVSIAVELITKPSVIFLDEPTSGLDPATEEKIMVLFRQIAESGRTVILTTHAMENVKLFDKIVLLMRGKLAFYGKPDEALQFLGAASFKELYDKLEDPIEERLKAGGGGNRHQVTEQVAEEWKQKYIQTPQYRKNVYEPLKELGTLQSPGVQKKRSLGIFGSIRQFMTLSRRYWEVLFRDKLNLFILFVQSPIIAFLTYLVMGDDQPRDFAYFVLSLVAVWFGTSVSAREIIRERPVYNRERMVNLGLMPYVMSKLFVLGFIVGLQCLFLFVPLKLMDVLNIMPMPGEFFGVPQFWAMLLTAGVGIALGLLISALVKTSEMATSLVPLILIPQILFSGLVGVPSGLNKVAGLIMPATWAFDTMKQFSGLEVLREDGDKDVANKDCSVKGSCGLYKQVEYENKQIIKKAEKDIADYKADAKKDMDKYKDDMDDYQEDMGKYQMGQISKPEKPKAPELKEVPKIEQAKEIPKDLSGYVDFLHPWMDEVLNQVVLMLMFFILVVAALIVLRMQDIA